MLFRLAYRNLFRNKGRTAITVAAVLFAVFFALLMRSLQLGVYTNMIDNVVGFYSGYLQVQQADYQEEGIIDNSIVDSQEFRDKLLEHPNVVDLVPRLENFALASTGTKSKAVRILGLDPEKEKQLLELDQHLVAGAYFADEKGVLLSQGVVDYLGVEIGDSIVFLGSGYHGSSAAGIYSLAGIVSFSSPALNSNFAFLSMSAMQEMNDAKDLLSFMVIQLNDIDKIDETLLELENLTFAQELKILGWKQLYPELVQIIEADNVLGLIILSILYAIIGFGMFGTILMMTKERIYEFGVMLSIGMKRYQLMIILFMESLFIAVLGVLLGIIVASPLLLYLHKNPIWLGEDISEFGQKYDVDPTLCFSIAPEIFWTQGLFVFFISLIISAYPLWKIARLQEVRALRSEG